ncbi:DUF6443 domain-containing protein [Chryseobacterium sp. G0201]|uniref:DUF6443 domain-containing protein n=1 Tax=Chryseobacterium sp. G0201 TaxID=2487065 RepID=UPI000F4D8D27|nr:DUF6443 domain-containing protein [Chryseobacterium sp. G0201]AZA53161.1 RHS repeat-associated core domain-containing protein [Chryseobacterium sp. G0201]
MKKIIIPIGALLITSLAHAQNLPNTENYIETRTYLEPVATSSSTAKQIHTVQYFDGLGRPKQVVNVKASPLGRDVVTQIEYDSFGRQTKDFLPVPQSQTLNGAIVPTPLANATNTPLGNEKIYAEKILENSPLDRIQQQIQVGTDWSTKPVKFSYDTNITNELFKFATSTTWENGATKSTLTNLWGYPPSQLYKNTVIDEDGNKTIEFKNGQGQKLLVRKMLSDTEHADTYYVYNEYNQLAFVIPPTAVYQTLTDDILNNLCYQYRYDGRNRLVEKKLPGKGWEYMLYDKQDRLVAKQDTVLKGKGQWLYTKYDQFGRVAITGIGTGYQRSVEQNTVDGFGSNNVNRVTVAPFNRQGVDVYYGSQDSSYPNSSNWVTLLSLTYYDTYPNYSFNPTFPTDIFGLTLTDNPATTGKSTKGLPVMSLVKNIEDDNWTKNYSYYDTRGRVVGTYSINHLGGFTETKSELDFAGATKQNITRHKRLNSDTEKVITETLEYDHQNRLLVHKHKIDNNTEEILAQNKYNELSQLESKKVGGTNIATPLQTIDYAYNIRGWLTKINNPTNLGGKLFGYEIKYNDPEPLLGIQEPKYNGNISEVDWKTATDGILKRYTYKYDGLNRLTYGKSYQPLSTTLNVDYYENVEYDHNGNITTLARGKKRLESASITEMIDNLTYNYQGNKLVTITDATGNSDGYKGGGNTITYDTNGNMTSMLDKKIKQIDYNFLNLPNYIQMNSAIGAGYTLNHIYSADGTKLTKQYKKLSTVINTDYLDGFNYEHSSMGSIASDLKFVSTTEGFYSFENNKYIYQYKDQVGNIRVSYYKDAGGNAVIDDAVDFYPFGFEHGAIPASTVTPNYKYSFQSQEKQVHTGWNSFKWRNYDPSLGRFFNIDPLSEKYAYQSHYNFSENRVIDGRELEGLEWVTTKNNQGVTTHRQLTVSIANDASLNERQFSRIVDAIKTDFSTTFGADGATAELIVSNNSTMRTSLVNVTSEIVTNENGEEQLRYRGGVTATLGESQTNTFSATGTVDGSRRNTSDITRSFNHEAAHAAGLDHPWENRDHVSDINQNSPTVQPTAIKSNLLNSGANPNSNYNVDANGTSLTPGQFNTMDRNIEAQQPQQSQNP